MFSQTDATPKTAVPAGKTVVLSFGPKLLELKASYLEKGERPTSRTTLCRMAILDGC